MNTYTIGNANALNLLGFHTDCIQEGNAEQCSVYRITDPVFIRLGESQSDRIREKDIVSFRIGETECVVYHDDNNNDRIALRSDVSVTDDPRFLPQGMRNLGDYVIGFEKPFWKEISVKTLEWYW